MPNVDAAGVLTNLALSSDVKKATAALEALNRRLPDPRYGEPRTSPFLMDDFVDMLYMSKNGWSAKYTADADSAARKLIQTADMQTAFYVSETMREIGTAQDLPVVEQTFDRLRNEPKTSGGLWSKEAVLSNLSEAAKEIAKRGAIIPNTPSSPGELMCYAVALSVGRLNIDDPTVMENLNKVFAAQDPAVSWTALKALWESKLNNDSRIAKIVAPYLPTMIESSDSTLQFYAIEWTSFANTKPVRNAILSALGRSTTNTIDLVYAAKRIGMTSVALMRLAKRMDDADNCNEAINALVSTVIVQKRSWSSNGNEAVKHLPELREAYIRFIDEHKKEIDAGKQWASNDPEISSLLLKGVADLN
jgi:hypothetical protein